MIIAIPVVKTTDRVLIYPHFGRTPYFAFVEVVNNKYRVLKIEENPYKDHEHGRGKGIVGYLLSHNVEAVIVSGIGYNAFNNLRSVGIKIYYIESEKPLTLDEVLKQFIEDKLTEAHKPPGKH